MISIVVPVYNTEKYLRKCLDSLANQTCKELEVILVDDGSKDKSGIICDEYAEQHDNFYACHQENKGVVAARNRGIEIAKGDYISFVDSDDWLDNDFYEKLISYVSDKDVDIVTSGMIMEWENKKRVVTDTVEEGIYCKEEIKEYIWDKMTFDFRGNRQGISASLSNKLIKRDALYEVSKQIDTNIKYCEDGAMVYILLTRINKLVVTHYCGYHYIQHSDSSIHTHSLSSFENISALQNCMKRILLDKENDEILKRQIDLYVEPLLRAVIKSVYQIAVSTPVYLFPFHRVPQNSKVVLYGAGDVGISYSKCLENKRYANVIAWVDKNYSQLGNNVGNPENILQKEFDYVVIAVFDEKVAGEIKKNLVSMGVREQAIIWERPYRIMQV